MEDYQFMIAMIKVIRQFPGAGVERDVIVQTVRSVCSMNPTWNEDHIRLEVLAA